MLFRSYSAEVKMRTYLRIAQLALSYGDAAEAEAYINRASMLQTDAKSDELNVMYKVSTGLFVSFNAHILEL